MEAELSEEVNDHLVVHGWEKLGDVDGEYRCTYRLEGPGPAFRFRSSMGKSGLLAACLYPFKVSCDIETIISKTTVAGPRFGPQMKNLESGAPNGETTELWYRTSLHRTAADKKTACARKSSDITGCRVIPSHIPINPIV